MTDTFAAEEEMLERRAEAALSTIAGADGNDIIASGLVYALFILDNVARVFIDDDKVDLARTMDSELPAIIENVLSGIEGIRRVVVKPRPKSISAVSELPGIARVIGVHSVKGGVGKSTVCAFLAQALARLGLRVGLLDADVYGPSAGLIFGVQGEARADAGGKHIKPLEKHGVKLMSLAFLLPDDAPLIWRGNLVDEGIPQMFTQVAWGDLDVLLVDMPPGTGDVPIAVARNSPLSGVLTVTAPSQLSVIDVRRGLEFFADIRVPIFGLVENMAQFVCDCGNVLPLFGSGGGADLERQLGVPMLASLPFSQEVAEAGEAGEPAKVDLDGEGVGASFMALAHDVALRLADKPADEAVQ